MLWPDRGGAGPDRRLSAENSPDSGCKKGGNRFLVVSPNRRRKAVAPPQRRGQRRIHRRRRFAAGGCPFFHIFFGRPIPEIVPPSPHSKETSPARPTAHPKFWHKW